MQVLKPQAGAQEMFLSSQADIVIYGGAAGGGKTYALLLEPLRHINNKDFAAVIFRKNANQIFTTGGLWDNSFTIYPAVGGRPVKTPKPYWRFPSGMKVGFNHLETEKDLLSWQGSQIAMIAFDELTHFSKQIFFYMLSRNRSTCGVRPYIRCTTNPDSESWVAEFIEWWIDQDTGYPIPDRSGVIRYMVKKNEQIMWGDTAEELVDEDTPITDIKSVTFIPSTLQDNKILMEKDPGYLANLKALPLVDRERLLSGNWKIRPSKGLYFKRSRVVMLEELPNDIVKFVRAWDLAASADKKNSRPDDGPAYTASVLLGKRRNGRTVVIDVTNKRMNAGDVRNEVKNTAIADKAKYKNVRIRMSQDPGQAGKEQAENYLKMLAGFNVCVERETGDKETRAEPFSAQWLGVEGSEYGNVDVMTADWNEAYFSQMEAFPEGKYKDMVDSSANAYNELEKHTISKLPRSTDGLQKGSYWNKL